MMLTLAILAAVWFLAGLAPAFLFGACARVGRGVRA